MRARSPFIETVARKFNLTPAEARLAAALASGAWLQNYAQTSGVSINTVKTQLRMLFQKTGTSRQVDLVRLLLELSAEQLAAGRS